MNKNRYRHAQVKSMSGKKILMVW